MIPVSFLIEVALIISIWEAGAALIRKHRRDKAKKEKNMEPKCGHCGEKGTEALCGACEYGFEAFRGDYGSLTEEEKLKLNEDLEKRRKANNWEENN